MRAERQQTGLLEASAAGHPLYEVALASAERMAGFYHQNMRVQTSAGPIVVRVPIIAADRMDLVIWPEDGVLRSLNTYVNQVPRLRGVSDEPAYLLIDWINGDLLDELAPKGSRIPAHVIRDIGEFFFQLGTIPSGQLPPLPWDWPANGDTAAFAHRLSDITVGVRARFLGEFGELFKALGFPADPLEPVLERWASLSSRPFRLLHTDIHRKNMIVDAGATYFLDWELALWGDPVYDLAVHLHKMAYQPDESDAAQAAWRAAVPAEAAVDWQTDLDTYLAHERVKSAVVDTVRYAKLIATGAESPDAETALIDKLVTKLQAAHAVWRTGHPVDRAEVEGHLRAGDAGQRTD